MIATLFGGLGGLALGVTGGVGAIMTLPLLVYGLQIPIHQAILFSLFIVGFSAFLGLLPLDRWRDLDKRMVFFLCLGAVLIVPFASYLSQHLKKEYLVFIFAVLMVFVGCFLWISEKALYKLKHHSAYCFSSKGTHGPSSAYLLLLFGGVTGFLTGFLGIGGGLMMMPALVLVLMLPLRQATSTSLMVIVVTSSIAIFAHIRHETINWYMLVSYLIGSVLGVFLGALVAKKIPKSILHRVMGTTILVVAIFMFYQLYR